MIQDILPLKLNNAYQKQEVQPEDTILGFQKDSVYLKENDGIYFLTYGELQQYCEDHDVAVPVCQYLFSVEDTHYFLADLADIEIEGYTYVGIQAVRALHPKEQIFAAATGLHLYNWYRDNQFCGRCGKKMVHSEHLRAMQCRQCGNIVFPKISPAVIVAVTNGDQILLTKYASGKGYRRYALVAGFTEIGETAEETVQREVMEEVGLRVKNIRYYKTQPWGFASDLLLGFFCELDGSPEIHMDQEELSVAQWVPYWEVPDDERGLSLTAEMMQVFKTTHMTGHPLTSPEITRKNPPKA